MFLRISPIIFSPFIINRISSLDELLSFGEISFDTVEPLADRFLITYQRWSQMMSDKEEIEKKKTGFLSFVQRDPSTRWWWEPLHLIWPLSRKNDRRSYLSMKRRRGCWPSVDKPIWPDGNQSSRWIPLAISPPKSRSWTKTKNEIKIKEHSTLMVSS